MSNQVSEFRLPDLLLDWPWPRRINPHYDEIKTESSAWLETFNAFDPKAQQTFNLCDFNLLASLAYPLASKQHLRTDCDSMNLFFVFDEYSDLADEHGTQVLANIMMDALRNPHEPRPKGECVLGEIARQFWKLAIQTASPSCQRHFISAVDSYTASVVQEAKDRTHHYMRTVDSYLELRRETIGVKPSFALLELDMNLPDEVLVHPSVAELATMATDMLILSNDLYSYNVEQARGHGGHNIVTIVMHEFNTNIHDAVDWVAGVHEDLINQFLENLHQVPSWGNEVDVQLWEYLNGMANWVSANGSWSFESRRYFGTQGLKIREHRAVILLPHVSELD